jgi:hypothetical protein
MFNALCFGVLEPLYTLGGLNFLIPNLFSTIVSVRDAPKEEVQVLFGHQKQWNPHVNEILKVFK